MVNEFYVYPINSRLFSIVGCLQVFGNVAYFWWVCYRFVICLINILNCYWWKIFQLSISLSDRKVWCANRNSDVLSVEHFEKIEHSMCSPARWYGGLRFDELSELGMNMCPLCFLCSSRCTSLPLFLISLFRVPSVEPVPCFLFSCPSSFSSWWYKKFFKSENVNFVSKNKICTVFVFKMIIKWFISSNYFIEWTTNKIRF